MNLLIATRKIVLAKAWVSLSNNAYASGKIDQAFELADKANKAFSCVPDELFFEACVRADELLGLK